MFSPRQLLLRPFRSAQANQSKDTTTELEARIAELEKTLHKIVSIDIAQIKKRIGSKPPIFDNLRMFTYMMDREFPLAQKRWFMERMAYRGLGYFPDLDNPKSFNEKTQWYKLHYQDPLITRCIDKYLFKDFVTQELGADFVTPTFGVWDQAAAIDFAALPHDFVLKSNWGSGSRHVILVKDKTKLKLDETRMKLSNWLQPWENVYYHTLDWGYKDIQPKIMAEKLITNKIFEYKFFCFNGEPKFFYAAPDSAPGVKNYQNFYDMDWNLLPVIRMKANTPYTLEKPKVFDEMRDIARHLSRHFPHTRVDLLQTTSGIIVEELTFYTGSGTGAFRPREWDYKFGEHFTLPPKSIGLSGQCLS